MNDPLSKYYGKMRSRPNPGSSESLLSVPEDNQGCFCDPQKNRHFKRQKSSGAVPENNDPSVDYEAEVLRRAMNQLSFAERETANRVVRGDSIIAQTILDRRRSSTQGLAEGNAFLSLKFQELDVHIRNSTTKLGFEAYQMARAQNEDYVDNPNFKIGFLRAERYNTLKAAHRLLLHFQEKLELFGPEKLTKDIEWDDLCEVAKWYHQHAGGVQLLPKRDKAGRLVVIMADVLQGRTEGKLMGIRRAYFYFFATLPEHDNEMGRVKGTVGIMWRVHRPTNPDPEVVQANCRIGASIPCKVSAYHSCNFPIHFNMDSINEHSKRMLTEMAGFLVLKHYRTHHGTALELAYQLQRDYGIPDCIPLQDESTGLEGVTRMGQVPFHFKYQNEWIAKRKRLEAAKRQVKLTRMSDSSFGRSPPLLTGNDLAGLFDSNRSGDEDSLEDLLGAIEDLESSEFGLDAVRFASGVGVGDSSRSFVTETPNNSSPGVVTEENGASTNASNMTEQPSVTDSTSSDSTRIPESQVRREDILLGKCPNLRNHPGNILCRELVVSRYDLYFSSTRQEKIKQSAQIVQLLRSNGGRFLHQANETETPKDRVWAVAGEDKARQKVSSTFRTMKRKERGRNTSTGTVNSANSASTANAATTTTAPCPSTTLLTRVQVASMKYHLH